ncbi:MAG: hypothetical protein AB7E60_02640 [Sphingobium sp.]
MAFSPAPDRSSHGGPSDARPSNGGPVIPSGRPGLVVLAGWLVCAGAMLWIFHGGFAALAFRDPDDALRLQQVRDWIAGQAFFDVVQHRVNPPAGGPMHWSRIVDMPIAALILLLRPVLGTGMAEIMACAAVPLLLLGGLCGALSMAVRRLDGAKTALVAALMLLITPSILLQFTPLRIDHHGWQIWMAAIALCGAFDPRPARGGATAALAMAVWLQISSEGLPYAALFGGLFALRYGIARDHGPRFIAYALLLGGAALALLIATRGWQAAFDRHCDTLSAAYVWPLAGFAVATPVAAWLLGGATPMRRLAVAAAGAGCALLILLATGGPCLAGDPFRALGPLAYRHWYLQVMEGRPIWEQGWSMAGVILLPALAGLVGTLAAAWHEGRRDAGRRAGWLALALLLIGATLVATMVMRALTVAHLMALPGIAWLVIHGFAAVQAFRHALARMVGSAALAVVTPAGLCTLWIAIVPSHHMTGRAGADCRAAATLAPLRALPPATLFAPLDIGPDIIVHSRHSVIATAHHRGAAGITAVIEGFMAPPDQARGVIGRLNGGRGADYVVTCGGLTEFAHYGRTGPAGLAAMLARGEVPPWLVSVPAPAQLQIYRVVDPAGR